MRLQGGFAYSTCILLDVVAYISLVTVCNAWSVALTKSLLNKDEISASHFSSVCNYISVYGYMILQKSQNSNVQYLSTTFSISVSKLFFGGARVKDKTLALFMAYLSINQNGLVYSG